MARDHQHWGKDERDRRKQKGRGPGTRASHVVAGVGGSVTAVRETQDRRGNVREIVTEERYDLEVPATLRRRVQNLFVKQNRVRQPDEPSEGTVRSRVLVITFADPQNGIRGLPASNALANKLRKCGFTHVTITWIPPNARDAAAGQRPLEAAYDERAYRIAWWKPRGGHRQEGEKGGEVVYEVHDELSVLQWISEGGLLALYEVPHLLSNGFLPKRDEDREMENGIAAQAQAFFGRPMGPVHAERTFHRARLFTRLVERFDGDTARARTAFGESVRAQEIVRQFTGGTFGHQTFHVSHARGVAYALFHLPNAKFVLRVDLRARTAHVEPMRVDRNGADAMLSYDRFLTNAEFRRMTWDEFRIIASGIGTAFAPAR